ncbi:MAG: histone deacetylase family protein [Candidatus Thorarchaeota archaeon]
MWNEGFERFDNGDRHPVRRGRFRAVRDYVRAMGFFNGSLVQEIISEQLPVSLIERIHDPQYIAQVKEISRTGIGQIDIDTPGFVGIYDTARWLCGSTTSGVTAILRGEINHFVTPTGGFHHAFRDHGGGFCVFNDVAASVYLLRDNGVHRILIVDLDVHHGNGIQDYFYEDPDVLYISLHEDPEWLYPHSGQVNEIGTGAGHGYTVNVPIPMDSGDAVYTYAFDEIVPPLATSFNPEFILYLPGFDSHYLDPLAHTVTTTALVKYTTEFMHRFSHSCCNGRLGLMAGGGYHDDALNWGVATAMAVLTGHPYHAPEEKPPIEDDEETWSEITSTIERIKELVFPVHNL